MVDILHAPAELQELGAGVAEYAASYGSQDEHVSHSVAEDVCHGGPGASFRVGILAVAADKLDQVQ